MSHRHTLSQYLQLRAAAPPPEGVMHPGHARWEEFYEKLAGPGYVNFRNENDGTRWDCKSGRDKSHAIRLLTEMGFTVQQIVETCVYFEDHGGMCDCEILWNVAPRAPRRTRKNPPRKRPALPPVADQQKQLTSTVNKVTPDSIKGGGSAE